jgi:hypothetical protein
MHQSITFFLVRLLTFDPRNLLKLHKQVHLHWTQCRGLLTWRWPHSRSQLEVKCKIRYDYELLPSKTHLWICVVPNMPSTSCIHRAYDSLFMVILLIKTTHLKPRTPKGSFVFLYLFVHSITFIVIQDIQVCVVIVVCSNYRYPCPCRVLMYKCVCMDKSVSTNHRGVTPVSMYTKLLHTTRI